jgi:hypothetical protein
MEEVCEKFYVLSPLSERRDMKFNGIYPVK